MRNVENVDLNDTEPLIITRPCMNNDDQYYYIIKNDLALDLLVNASIEGNDSSKGFIYWKGFKGSMNDSRQSSVENFSLQ
jgi:hypothetical protein